MLVSMNTTNLKFFYNTNLTSKRRVMALVAYFLMKKGFSASKVSYWLGWRKDGVLYYSPKNYDNFKSLLGMLKVSGWKKDVFKNVKWFEKHQHPVLINRKDYDYVLELLLSNQSTSKIASSAVVLQPTISYLRNGKRSISKLSSCILNRLINYFKNTKPWVTTIDLMKLSTEYSSDGTSGEASVGKINHQCGFITHHIFPKKFSEFCLKHLQGKCEYNSFYFGCHSGILVRMDELSSSVYPYGFMNKNAKHPNLDQPIIFDNVIDKFKKYSKVPPKKRFTTDSLYMSHDLKHKQHLILHSKSPINKIAIKLHLNKNMVKRVKKHQLRLID